MSELKKDIENKEKEIKELFESIRPEENEIPERVDKAVLASILEKPQKPDKRNYKKIYYWFSAAAAVVIISFIIKFSTIEKKAPVEPDIVDLYILNRQINSNKKVSKSWDTDKNGIVNNEDIEQLAMMIVKVD